MGKSVNVPKHFIAGGSGFRFDGPGPIIYEWGKVEENIMCRQR